MDSMMVLSTLLIRCQRIESPRKLQPIVFLTQMATGKTLYRYRLSLGKVVSDDLDQDVAYLEATGMLSPVCDTEERALELNVSPEAAPISAPMDEYSEFLDVFSSLFEEKADVLEGAATLCRFRESARGASAESLLWFRALSVNTRKSAYSLCDKLAKGGPDAPSRRVPEPLEV